MKRAEAEWRAKGWTVAWSEWGDYTPRATVRDGQVNTISSIAGWSPIRFRERS
jgi:hypothetical protein